MQKVQQMERTEGAEPRLAYSQSPCLGPNTWRDSLPTDTFLFLVGENEMA